MSRPRTTRWLWPRWHPHPRVRTLVTTRAGSFSPPPWDGFNLGTNCGDDPQRVVRARQQVHEQLALPYPPAWLEQLHGDRLIRFGDPDVCADGSWTTEPGRPCVVLTADCLPVLLARQDGTAVAAVHAGWRGLHAGILARAVHRLAPHGQALSAWFGPAISGPAYQVGEEVHDAFLSLDDGYAGAFAADPEPGRWRFSLVHAARLALRCAGVEATAGGDRCTVGEPDCFYSFRAEGRTGRFASLIWLAPA